MKSDAPSFLLGTDVMMGSAACYPWVIDYSGTIQIRPVAHQDGLPWIVKAPLTLPEGTVALQLPPPPPKGGKNGGINTRA